MVDLAGISTVEELLREKEPISFLDAIIQAKPSPGAKLCPVYPYLL
jgi:hypothetical protein